MSWRTFRRKGSQSDFAFPTITIHGDGTRFRATLRPGHILAIDLRTPVGAARGSVASG